MSVTSMVVVGWESWLRLQGFDCFFTVTFREPQSSAKAAIRKVSRVLSKFYDSMGGEVAAFLAAEPHVSGVYHVHGLMRLGVSAAEFQAVYLQSLWKAAFDACGRSSFELIRDLDKSLGYVVKYCLKDGREYALVGRGLGKASRSLPQGKVDGER